MRAGSAWRFARPNTRDREKCSSRDGAGASRRSRHSIQVDFNHHIEFPSPIRIFNHSCEPNCGYLVRAADEILEVVAIRPIAAGEELTVDYATFEEEIEHMPGPCLCGAPSCRGRILGYHALPKELRERYGSLIAPYLRELEEGRSSRAG